MYDFRSRPLLITLLILSETLLDPSYLARLVFYSTAVINLYSEVETAPNCTDKSEGIIPLSIIVTQCKSIAHIMEKQDI